MNRFMSKGILALLRRSAWKIWSLASRLSRSSELTRIDPLLAFHSNHAPIPYRSRDKRRFQSKVANFPTPGVFKDTVEGVHLGIGYRRSDRLGATGRGKKFDDIFSRLDTIHERDERTDWHRTIAKRRAVIMRFIYRWQTARRICAICNGVDGP